FDFGGIAEIAGALGSDFGVIGKDDRRGQHGVARAGRTDEDGPYALIHTLRRGCGEFRGRVGRRYEITLADGDHGVSGPKRSLLRERQVRRIETRGVAHEDGELVRAALERSREKHEFPVWKR